MKKADFTTSPKVAKKKAVTVKKGTTKLRVKAGGGYVMFKAPKTKTYYLTFSNVKSKNGVGSMFVFIQKPSSGKYIFSADVKTKGGKTHVLWLADKKNVNKSAKDAKDWCLASRTATIKLKKGQMLFMNVYDSNSVNLTLKIK